MKDAAREYLELVNKGSTKGVDTTKHTKSVGYQGKCSDTHKPLVIKEGCVVYGGSATNPVRKDLDVYVCLDGFGDPYHKHPWEGGTLVLYPIKDMSVPDTPGSFVEMIDWLAEEIISGSNVHVGCIGGHGRTGMVLSALVKVIANVDDAVTFVRKGYCEKVVETSAQSSFLNKHFGIKIVEGRKDSYYQSYGKSYTSGSYGYTKPAAYHSTNSHMPEVGNEKVWVLESVPHNGNIWGTEELTNSVVVV